MKKSLTLILAVFSFTLLNAQGFYDLNTIQSIEITFAESNWDALLDAEMAGEQNYIMAQSVSINGEVYDSVGVKYKGNSTYKANQVKNPFHIELDTYKDQDYEGYTDIKLSNVANDPSFLREVLSYQILGQYMDAPLSNYANVYVNGNLIGLYTNSEAVSKKFVNSRFGSKTNTFIKCNPPDGAGPGTTDLPNLVYRGTDSTLYYNSYELKSDHGWNDLVDLCDTLSNSIDAIEEILDVDRALWMLAWDNALVNLDSYIGAFSQNYYLYRDDNGRFVPVVWDLNESFGRFSQTGSLILRSTTDMQRMSHLLHASESQFPLISMLLSVPMYKRMYLAHFKTIMLENFDDNSYYSTGLEIQNNISAAVQADRNKFFTYNNFISNLSTDVSSGPPGPNSSITPGITNLMNGRNSYLLALPDFTNTAPGISDIVLSEDQPVIGTTITISAAVSDPAAVYLAYRNDSELPFIRVEMLDDGSQGDLSPGDGIFSAPIALDKALIQYYIYAENDKAGMFSPQRAEHEFHEINATLGEVIGGDVLVNEFMASNSNTFADENGEYSDWIELYNNGDTAIDLSAFYLSDDSENLLQWEFPAGTQIDAGAYLLVWADGSDDQDGLHASFKLSASGEELFFMDSSGQIIDTVMFSEQSEDVSLGRLPNGTGPFLMLVPSPMEINLEEKITDSIYIVSDSTLVINEFMASNSSVAADEANEYDDWIELFNTTENDILLDGYALSDKAEDLTQWEFPAGTTISAGGYLIIWADNEEDQEGLHASFKISASSGALYLTDPLGTVIDGVSYAEQSSDMSYARFPNGSGDFMILSPTFEAENGKISSLGSQKEIRLNIIAWPNPASDYFNNTLNGDVSEDAVISIYNLTGRLVFQSEIEEQLQINTSDWDRGMYMIRVSEAYLKLLVL